MKILIVGGGNMGRTYAESFISNHSVARRDLFILEKAEDKIPYFKSLGFEAVFSEPEVFIFNMDLIILAVKPQDIDLLFSRLKEFMRPDQLILSIMAGVTIERLKESLPTEKIIRAMPNLPTQVGMGMTGFTAHSSVSRSELFSVQNLLNTTGKSLYFDDEGLLDGVTAISGSGPAYVYYFMQAIIDSAQKMGFSPSEAETMVEQTFLGAIHLLNNNNFTCKEWIDKVSSRGGTTEAATNNFSLNGLKEKIESGLFAAFERSKQLGS
jgi:pyrroline-5-carboxylate reductase